jgi:hypothetical protein
MVLLASRSSLVIINTSPLSSAARTRGQGGTIRLRPGLLLAEYPVRPSRLQRGDLCIKRLT